MAQHAPPPSLTRLSYNPFSYKRRHARVVMVGSVAVGGNNPLRVQSMTTTDTMNTDATVEQTLRLAAMGCEIVRITAPNEVDARNLEKIKSALIQRGCLVPLVADIHFRPEAAMIAADFVEKVRVNPGNYVDSKLFRVREYTQEQYDSELHRIEDRFTPLVEKMKRLKRALRIGTNHGSLSDRLMNRYGDTPEGMVESALEYVRICRKNDFHDIILSMKASNPRVMVAAYRLLAVQMQNEGMDYPFHLGVTEAGDGQDGRIKSAAGIGSLLEDGIGDTIRVSLTEDPEREVPVAQEISARYSSSGGPVASYPHAALENLPYLGDTTRRTSEPVMIGPIVVGGSAPVRVVSALKLRLDVAKDVMALMEHRLKKDTPPEILDIVAGGENFDSLYQEFREDIQKETSRLACLVTYREGNLPETFVPAEGYAYRFEKAPSEAEIGRLLGALRAASSPLVLRSGSVDALLSLAGRLGGEKISLVLSLEGPAAMSVHATRALAARLQQVGMAVPVLLSWPGPFSSLDGAAVLGSLICDGIGDAIFCSTATLSDVELDFSYNLLQACGTRITKTEFVSCPSCGRTLFDLQSTTERIKSKTGHLKGVKIAIMGCIVNGPGEMADADFGYVGGGPGKINLYVGKTCVEKSIPTDDADNRLIDLIKTHGKWIDPPQ